MELTDLPKTEGCIDFQVGLEKSWEEYFMRQKQGIADAVSHDSNFIFILESYKLLLSCKLFHRPVILTLWYASSSPVELFQNFRCLALALDLYF